MRAELKGIDCTDLPEGLGSYQPDDPHFFSLVVDAKVGPVGEPGEDLFSFTVCTAEWLQGKPPPKGFEFLRHHVLLERWDYDLLLRVLRDLCLHSEGRNWEEVATKLARFGRWEFEDYEE